MNRKLGDDPLATDTPLSVLVVDDSEDSAELLAELLACSGHRVRVANLGRAALDRVQEEAPDVVLLDLDLPDLDGYEVATAIRTRFGESIRVVALTGYNGSEERANAMAAGFNAFLAKPCSSRDLERALLPRAPKP